MSYRSVISPALAIILVVLTGCGQDAPSTVAQTAGPVVVAAEDIATPDGIAYLHEARGEPRPLHIHSLAIDLTDPAYAFTAAVAPDPDGDGPAEAALTAPTTLAADHHLIAAINANPFSGLPDANGESPTNWHPGMPVDILGLAAADSVIHSASHKGYPAVWLGDDGRVHLGVPDADTVTAAGAAGFHYMLKAGELAVPEGGPLHPRSAIGIDAKGETLYLVVVDGRQTGYSEGMTVHELAVYMKELGAHDAINLDGGGSSILLLAAPDGTPRALNRPSRRVAGISFHRPVPILLGLRKATPAP